MKLHFWDTYGQEKYVTMVSMFYNLSHAALFVYSVDDNSSLK